MVLPDGPLILLSWRCSSLAPTAAAAVFQQDYARALRGADLIVLSAVYSKENDALVESEMLSTDRLVSDLGRAGVTAWSVAGRDEILARLATELRSGDVVLCMSNGAFGNLPRRIVAALS